MVKGIARTTLRDDCSSTSKMDTLLLFLTGIVSVIVFCKEYLLIHIPEIVIILLFSFFFLFTNAKHMYFAMSLCFMLELWIPFTYIVIVGAAINLLRFQDFEYISKDLLIGIVFIVFQLFSVFAEGLSISILGKVGISFFAQIYLFSSIHNVKESTSFAYGIVVGFVILSFMTLLIATKYMRLASIILQFRLGSNTMTRWIPQDVLIPNENNLARYAVFAITVVIVLHDTKRLSSFFYYSYISYSIIIILLTKSRSGLALLLLTFLTLYFITGRYKKRSAKMIRDILLLVVSLFAIILIVDYFMPNLIPSIMSRFNEEDLSNGRVENFKFYHDVWVSKTRWILFGFGDQNVSSRFSRYNSVHSAIQAYFVHYGIFGFSIFMLFLVSHIKHYSSRLLQKRTLICWLPIFIVGVGKLFGAMNTTELLVAIAISTLYINDYCQGVNCEKQV